MDYQEFNGIYDCISNKDYQAAAGLSRSGLNKFAISPAHYQAYIKEKHVSTPDQVKFTMVHRAILEPDKFKDSYKVVDGNRNRKDVRAQVELGELAGKDIIKSSDLTDVIAARDSVREHKKAVELICDGHAELSLFWETNGCLFKCRPDFLTEDCRIVDVKCFWDLRNHNLESQIYKQRYHWQAYFYAQGVKRLFKTKQCEFYFIFVEAKPPYGVRVVKLHESAFEKAEHEMKPHLEFYRKCFENNNWPGYEPDVQDIGIPSYATL